MNWLDRLLGRTGSSAEIAKNRLKVVLSYDRTNLTPDMLTMLQDEIVSAISRHLDIDREGMTFSTQRGDRGDHLVADIPIRGVRADRPSPAYKTPVSAPPARVTAGGGGGGGGSGGGGGGSRKKHKRR